MRKSVVFISFMTACFISGGASEARVVSLSGSHSRGDIKSHCDAIGGTTTSGIGSGGYGCVNGANGNSVDCDSKGHCKGIVSRQTGGGGVRGVLAPTAGADRTGSGGNVTRSAMPTGGARQTGGFKQQSGDQLGNTRRFDGGNQRH
ncbi:MAG: hypothetical protein NVSMB26_29010 [Beijerinckiaceae bacterium]